MWCSLPSIISSRTIYKTSIILRFTGPDTEHHGEVDKELKDINKGFYVPSFCFSLHHALGYIPIHGGQSARGAWRQKFEHWHKVHHDFESFYWLLVYLVLRHSNLLHKSESMAYGDLSDSSYKKTNDAVKAKNRWLQAESLPDLQECVIDCSST